MNRALIWLRDAAFQFIDSQRKVTYRRLLAFAVVTALFAAQYLPSVEVIITGTEFVAFVSVYAGLETVSSWLSKRTG